MIMLANLTPQDAYHELSYYTLTHPDPAFIHQHIVDAFAAQTADKNTKPISITFALIGLYLAIEKGFTGSQVQQAHMKLANPRRQWPTFPLPENRGDITVFDVLAAPPGRDRDEMIHTWCVSIWDALEGNQQQVRDLVRRELQIS